MTLAWLVLLIPLVDDRSAGLITCHECLRHVQSLLANGTESLHAGDAISDNVVVLIQLASRRYDTSVKRLPFLSHVSS